MYLKCGFQRQNAELSHGLIKLCLIYWQKDELSETLPMFHSIFFCFGGFLRVSLDFKEIPIRYTLNRRERGGALTEANQC